jgi:hypothetical protein
MSEILQQEIAPVMEKQIKAWEMQAKKSHSNIEAGA